MKKILLGLLVTLNLCVFGQKTNFTNPTAMNVNVELGGPGLASINFDSRFTKKQNGIGGKIGVGGFSLSASTSGTSSKVGVVFVPISINYLIGKEKNFFEVGGGLTPVFSSSSSTGTTSSNFSSTFGHLILGYRLQPANSGFTFRGFLSPVFNKSFFWPYWGGVSLGYKF